MGSWWISPQTRHILSFYRKHLEWEDSMPTNFGGVASEQPPPVQTNESHTDMLYCAASVNFNNADALVQITAIGPQYQWMVNHDPVPQATPINAVAGVFSQIMPIVPLVSPFFVKAGGRLRMQFTNSAAAPTTGGFWTWRALKLIDPIDGGWDYLKGFTR